MKSSDLAQWVSAAKALDLDRVPETDLLPEEIEMIHEQMEAMT